MKPEADFPRLLVATEFPPNGAGGGAAVVRQMLNEWPREKLFWWSCQPDRNELFGRKTAEHCVAGIPPVFYPNRRWRAQKSWMLDTFWVPWAARHLRNTLDKIRPDVVWVIPHCYSIPPVAQVLPHPGVGFHVSIHDYMTIRGAIDKFGAGRARQMQSMADRLYARAATRDSICRAMADDLQARTGRAGAVNRAGLEQEDFDYLSHEREPHQGPLRIAYAGTIVAADEFAIVAGCLRQLRSRLPRPVILELYGDHSYRSQPWFDASWMKENGNLPGAELKQELKGCDWGFSPMRLADDDPPYNRFSLPTKFASYLAAGLPIITVGHHESTVVKMASEYQVGLCLTENDLENFETKLLATLSAPNPKLKYQAEIHRCALAEFDARRMRALLHDNLRTCANSLDRG